MPTRGHINGEPRIGSHRGRGHVVTGAVAWSGRTQDNHNITRQIGLAIAGAIPVPGADGNVIWNNGGVLAGAPIWTFGFWNALTNGSGTSPELIFTAEGDAIAGFTPQPPPE